MPTLYRGEPVPRLNTHELSNGVIQAQSASVYNYTNTTREAMQKHEKSSHMLGVHVDDLPGDMRERRETFTPGFSESLGAAMFFSHYNMEDPGLVFSFDSDAIPDANAVEYTLEWFDDNPGLLARVDTLSDGEIRLDGELLAITDDEEVWHWGDRLREGIRGTYEDEAEWFTPETGISVTRGLQTVTSYVGTSSATSGSIDTILGQFEDYAYGWGSSGAQNVKYMDEREKVEAYHEEVAAEMNMLSDRLVVVLLEEQGRIQKTDAGFREKFVAAYDGDSYYTRASDVPDASLRL